jgi:hypothetical protein
MCLFSTDLTALAGHQFGAQGVFFSIVHLLFSHIAYDRLLPQWIYSFCSLPGIADELPDNTHQDISEPLDLS